MVRPTDPCRVVQEPQTLGFLGLWTTWTRVVQERPRTRFVDVLGLAGREVR
jgi:hypothetical protein